jgi:hemolysin type calcium-binding protein/calcineurin-like phosphoesterase family protein
VKPWTLGAGAALATVTAGALALTGLLSPGGGPARAAPRAVDCFGRPATIVGTPGNDRLVGTPRPDVIAGLGGDDAIQGREGADLVCGGPGDDVIEGGGGNDRLSGGADADTLDGGSGRDALDGGPGADACLQGAGSGARAACETPATDRQPRAPIRAAFYYPRYPAGWRQQGIFPYTLFNPSLGFYDTRKASVVRRHIAAMRYGGMEAGIASWRGPATPSDGRVAGLLRAARGTPFRWSLYVENEAGANPGVGRIRSWLRYVKRQYGADPAFLRIGGRPVVFVYAGSGDRCGMATRWTRANSVGVHLVLKVFPGFRACRDQPQGWHQYAPAQSVSDQSPYAITISPGFHLVGEAAPRLARDPVRWSQDVAAMAASRATFQLVTTFNEWAEGTSVESAREWESPSGFGVYLDVLRAAGRVGGAPAPLPTPGGDPVIAAAGDIACDPASALFNGGAGTRENCNQRATSDLLLDGTLAAVLPLGDIQYEDGAYEKFLASYDPTWGRVKAITRPVVGNHEYLTPAAAGYFRYFGAAAGDPATGWYSFDLGRWHLIALNSNCSKIGGCEAGSPQERWLRRDLARHRNLCTLAYWHHPRFSSGQHQNRTDYDAFWRALHAAGADLVLVGHDHDYERFAPQDPDMAPDPGFGIRQIVVGTGGRNHYRFIQTQPNSEVRDAMAYGVLRLTLRPAGYDWQFVPAAGSTFTDAGSGACHPAPPAAAGAATPSG